MPHADPWLGELFGAASKGAEDKILCSCLRENAQVLLPMFQQVVKTALAFPVLVQDCLRVIEVDACPQGIGGVLFTVEDGVKWPTAFFGGDVGSSVFQRLWGTLEPPEGSKAQAALEGVAAFVALGLWADLGEALGYVGLYSGSKSVLGALAQ